MSNIIQEVFRHLNDDVIIQITRQIGASDANQVKRAAQGATELLVDALSRQAQHSGQGLYGAIERDHNGGILENLKSILTGTKQASNPKTMDGAGILNHLLGNKQLEAAQVVSQMSGLNFFKSGVLMQLIAPVIMGVLGQKRQSGGLDLGGLLNVLTGAGGASSAQSPAGGILKKILDRDGDGNMMDDLLNIGMQILKK